MQARDAIQQERDELVGWLNSMAETTVRMVDPYRNEFGVTLWTEMSTRTPQPAERLGGSPSLSSRLGLAGHTQKDIGTNGCL